ncbi:MAG TPA: ABC transporter ATP-binding protein [Bacillota bacterium]
MAKAKVDPVRLSEPAARATRIAARGLTVAYEGRTILAGVDLKVAAGELVAVIGPSGTGKSTLLRALAGLVPVAGGKVELCGCGRRARISFVFQEPRLLPWLTVADNVAFGLHGERLPAAERRARVLAALEAVGLADCARAWPRQLSGGMAQRVALARALVTRPDVLLLDEPFSAVDALTRVQLQEHLLDLWRREGFSAILVTHDVDEASYLADRVYVLTGRPAGVTAVVPVDAQRPRHRSDPRLAALRGELLASLGS